LDKLVYIIRHGETDFNRQGIVQGGGVDTSLNATGQAQAQAFFAAYGHLPFEVVMTSCLKRTHETVAPFLRHGLPWEQFPEINEMGWGDHEGKRSTPESRAEYQAVVSAWQSGDYTAAMSNGESAAELGQRLASFVDHLRQRSEDLLLVCSHGRAMRGLMCLLKGLPLAEMQHFGHSNTGLWLVQQASRAVYSTQGR
jgi:broad specificity phosphatase PhoE